MNACHLDAARIQQALPAVVAPDTRLLFIENVGNLVCPAAFDLGEAERAVLLSTPEGEDKPLKYPVPFRKCSLVLLTKTDLVPHLGWERARCRDYLRRIVPSAPVLELSALTGVGLEAWIDHLERGVHEQQRETMVPVGDGSGWNGPGGWAFARRCIAWPTRRA